MYKITFDNKAVEFISKLDYKTKKRIFEKIVSTKEKPFRYFQKLTYREGYKLRVGSYRVIADIDKNPNQIKIRIIMHRKNIYR